MENENSFHHGGSFNSPRFRHGYPVGVHLLTCPINSQGVAHVLHMFYMCNSSSFTWLYARSASRFSGRGNAPRFSGRSNLSPATSRVEPRKVGQAFAIRRGLFTKETAAEPRKELIERADQDGPRGRKKIPFPPIKKIPFPNQIPIKSQSNPLPYQNPLSKSPSPLSKKSPSPLSLEKPPHSVVGAA